MRDPVPKIAEAGIIVLAALTVALLLAALGTCG